MLFGLGPFRFTVPKFSVEEVTRTTGGRIAQQDIIGAAPITHLLGPTARSFSLSSTFHPLQLNRAGGPMLDAIHLAAEQQTPLLLLAIYGRVFGTYVIESVESGHTMFSASGKAQTVTATINLAGYSR